MLSLNNQLIFSPFVPFDTLRANGGEKKFWAKYKQIMDIKYDHLTAQAQLQKKWATEKTYSPQNNAGNLYSIDTPRQQSLDRFILAIFSRIPKQILLHAISV